VIEKIVKNEDLATYLKGKCNFTKWSICDSFGVYNVQTISGYTKNLPNEFKSLVEGYEYLVFDLRTGIVYLSNPEVFCKSWGWGSK